jgi:hypothetical protein
LRGGLINVDSLKDIGGWVKGAADDTGDWFKGAYNDVSYFAGHNPGISILGGLAVVSVTEPLALTVLSFTNSTVAPFLRSPQQSFLCLECPQRHH